MFNNNLKYMLLVSTNAPNPMLRHIDINTIVKVSDFLLIVISFRRLAFSCLLVVRCWLLGVGYWVLVISYWLLVISYWLASAHSLARKGLGCS
ncbi:hypothetical protein [Olivibacter jilunii]|uniref:hypothetical protein n=1 Tax=Olivibacter jilunii TaxID=985016 RepID=UPI003F139869